MNIPKGVTVMIDAGVVFKLYGANIDVGSSAIGIDRSGGALQVLGTPQDSVYFTSYLDRSIGKDNNQLLTTPLNGNWGGLVFRSNLDHAYNAANPASPRPDAEAQGIFLDYVNHADILYGGGTVTVNSVRSVYDPIYMVETRVTATYNTITHSADAAISADPNSFKELTFEGYGGSDGPLYTADYDRTGPDLHANLLTGDSVNGILVRIATDSSTGNVLNQLTVSACFDDPDIVYVVPQAWRLAVRRAGRRW